MLIYKENLPIDTLDIVKISLPFEKAEDAAKAVLHVAEQRGVPCMWYDADSKITEEKKEFYIVAIGTGHYWKDILKKEQYIGTILTFGESLVLHYFIVNPEEFKDYIEIKDV